jgi:tRNA-2-methylthio-N6-dimethylallyladenosine synthase
MPSLHMPMQSGSDAVLKAMHRSYRADRYLGILDRVRAAIPDAAITTDIIVGFPGETDADFEATLDVARAARFAGAFTFQYSKRPGTPAAEMPDQVPAEVVAGRYQRLVTLIDDIAWDENKKLEGATNDEHVAEGEGRDERATHRMSFRARDKRLVHFSATDARPGDIATVEVTYAAPHHLVADRVLAVRRTPGGDAWQARHHSPPASVGVPLGMPTLRPA